jgi:hypothetical protein
MRSIRWKVFLPIFALFIAVTLLLSIVTGRMTRNKINEDFESYSSAYLDQIYSLVSQYHEASVIIRELKLEETELRLRHLVEGSISILNDYHQREVAGELSREAAQRLAADSIREIRYGPDGYFWIDDSNYINIILPPNTAVEGTSRYDLLDVTGQYIVRDMVDGAMAEGSFSYEYYFPKPGEEESSPKMGFVQYSNPGAGYWEPANTSTTSMTIWRSMKRNSCRNSMRKSIPRKSWIPIRLSRPGTISISPMSTRPEWVRCLQASIKSPERI